MLPFKKMHGLGNDFVILDGRTEPLSLTHKQIIVLADRHRGIGCDQLLILRHSADADCRMDVYNADGSPSGACGNGTRCVARILINEKHVPSVTVETVGGILEASDAGHGHIRVDMGPPKLEWQDIPLTLAHDTAAIKLPEFPDLPPGVAVNMGNPHIVFFVKDVEEVPLSTLGPKIENHPLFPDRTNVEFCHLIDAHHLRMRVWERGSGITQACGTGACAAFVAAVRRNLVQHRADVHLDGGMLRVEWTGSRSTVFMTGPAELSFSGILSPELLSMGA